MTGRSSGSPSDDRERAPERRRPPVLLDANALLLPFRAGLPLEQEVERLVPGAELLVPRSVLAELDGLVARGVRYAAAARRLASRFRPVDSSGRGDAALIATAVAERASVVTADAVLIDRLFARGVVVYAPRDRVRLEHVARGRGRARHSPGPRVPPPGATVKKRPRLERERASDARRRQAPRPSGR